MSCRKRKASLAAEICSLFPQRSVTGDKLVISKEDGFPGNLSAGKRSPWQEKGCVKNKVHRQGGQGECSHRGHRNIGATANTSPNGLPFFCRTRRAQNEKGGGEEPKKKKKHQLKPGGFVFPPHGNWVIPSIGKRKKKGFGVPTHGTPAKGGDHGGNTTSDTRIIAMGGGSKGQSPSRPKGKVSDSVPKKNEIGKDVKD